MMKPDAFVRSILGYWSSHPLSTERRSFHAATVALLPITLFGFLLAYRLRAPSGWISLIENYYVWLVGLLIVASGTLAALLTVAVKRRLAAVRFQGKSELHSLSGDWIDGWLVLPVLALAVVLPWSLRSLLGSHPLSDWVIRCVVFLPIFTLLTISATATPDPRSDHPPRRRWWLLGLSVSFLAAAIITTVYDVSVRVGADNVTEWLDRWIPWYRDQQLPLLGWMLFGFPSFIAYTLFRIWTKQGNAPDAEYLSRYSLGELLRSLSKVFLRESPKESEKASDETMVPLLQVLLGAAPTERESALLPDVIDWSIATDSDTDFRTRAVAVEDLILDGQHQRFAPSAGMLALSLGRYLTAGSRVLFLVARARDVDARERPIRERLSLMDLDDYVRLESSRSRSVAGWADRSQMPDIFVQHLSKNLDSATVRDWAGIDTYSPFRFETIVIDCDDRVRVGELASALSTSTQTPPPFLITRGRLNLPGTHYYDVAD